MNDGWLVWQILDSGFPTGGFAHSSGLEAAWQSGEIPDAAALGQFVRDSVWQAGHAGLPLVTATHAAGASFARVDARCDAFLSNPVANRASRVQGRALAATCARVWPSGPLVALDAEARLACGHYAPVFGAAMGALEIARPIAQRMFLFTTVRGVLTAAVRLGIVGSYQAQQMQSACATDLDAVVEACGRLGEEDVAQSAPIVDLLQASHDALYSRLFQS